jgi:hypothetical protein
VTNLTDPAPRATEDEEGRHRVMMEINQETVIWEILAAMPEAKALFDDHGCDMDAECHTTAMTNTLQEAVDVCHLVDPDGLILELQALADITAGQPAPTPEAGG